MKCGTATRQRRHSVSAQACRSQNRMHMQKALMEYLLLGRLA